MAREREHLSAVDRMIAKAVGRDETLGNQDDPVTLIAPVTLTWLTRVDCGKGLVKEPAKLTLKAVSGGFLVTISDISLGKAIDVLVPVLGDLWVCLETALTQAVPNIRQFGRGDTKLRKRKGDN